MSLRNSSTIAASPRWLLVALLLCNAACFVFSPGGPQEPHRWADERGPVIPHDSFPADCSLCHLSGDWHTLRADFSFDHAKETGHALEGAHAEAQCLRCHNDRGPVQQFASRGCAGCHEDPHQSRLGPNCSTCHDQVSWLPQGQIAEHARTRFPLVASHAGVACMRCHPGAQVGNFQRASIRCEDCHQADLQRATDPDHAALGWTTSCERCHLPTSFGEAKMDHSLYPLIGEHQSTACTACHVNGVYRGTPRDCASCHVDEYFRTTNPNHAAAGFPTTCEQCHTPRGWDSTGFNHSFYPLLGRHASQDCASCHANGVYQGTPTACNACHLDDYNQARDPNHVTAGFPTTCEQCHTPNGWEGARFDHSSFALTGRHVSVGCTACHIGGVYQGTPRNCSGCHLDDYNRTTNPGHAAAGFSTTCETCHTTNGWPGATFAHTTYALTGAHASTSCNACHGNGVYQGTPRNCSACHLGDYNATRNPNHTAANFPTTCESCHTTTRWQGATFNHRFPLAGNHNLACSTCHTNAANFQVFDCTNCHAHRRSEMDDEHREVSGYVYQSQACYNCHPNGRESGGAERGKKKR
ncbi:MAG: hypothetical protein IPN34_16350 [Planctomycetes bacterium]|nr:hypothetical protein [Planctomycetota bacterium]